MKLDNVVLEVCWNFASEIWRSTEIKQKQKKKGNHGLAKRLIAVYMQSSLLWAVVIYMLLQNESHLLVCFHFYNRNTSLIKPNVKNASLYSFTQRIPITTHVYA